MEYDYFSKNWKVSFLYKIKYDYFSKNWKRSFPLRIIVTGVLADRKPVELHLFTNYQSPSFMIDPTTTPSQYEDPPPPHQQLIWEAARASGAAPSYFRWELSLVLVIVFS